MFSSIYSDHFVGPRDQRFDRNVVHMCQTIYWRYFSTGLTLEEMDDVFGAGKKIAVEDQARQDAIMQRLGLFHNNEKERRSDEEYVESKGSKNWRI